MIHFDLSFSLLISRHVILNHMRAVCAFHVLRFTCQNYIAFRQKHASPPKLVSTSLEHRPEQFIQFSRTSTTHTRFPFVAFRRRLRRRFCIRLKQRDHAMNFEQWCARKETQIRGGMRTESQIARTFLFTRWASLVVNHRVRWVARARAKGECARGTGPGRGMFARWARGQRVARASLLGNKEAKLSCHPFCISSYPALAGR